MRDCWQDATENNNVIGQAVAVSIVSPHSASELEYDLLSDEREIQHNDSSNNTVTVEKLGFDALGRQVSRNVNNGTTTNIYDALDRVTKILLPDPDDAMVWGSSYTDTTSSLPRPYVLYAFDANGNRTSETNEIGEVTSFAFDTLGRVTTRTDPTISAGTPVTSYTYDVYSNRTVLTDPVGNDTTWVYNLLDQVTSETNELSKTRSFTYNVGGELLTRTDRKNRIISYERDGLGRLLRRSGARRAMPR